MNLCELGARTYSTLAPGFGYAEHSDIAAVGALTVHALLADYYANRCGATSGICWICLEENV